MRIVRGGLGQFDALPHALAVGGHRAVGGILQSDELQGGSGALVALGIAPTVHAEVRVDELVTGEAFRKGVELGAVSHDAAEALGMGGRDAQHADLALGGADEAG